MNGVKAFSPQAYCRVSRRSAPFAISSSQIGPCFPVVESTRTHQAATAPTNTKNQKHSLRVCLLGSTKQLSVQLSKQINVN
jgi:hypothetical protein